MAKGRAVVLSVSSFLCLFFRINTVVVVEGRQAPQRAAFLVHRRRDDDPPSFWNHDPPLVKASPSENETSSSRAQSSLDPKHQAAWGELKDRAESTARMETTKTLANKIVDALEKITKRKKPTKQFLTSRKLVSTTTKTKPVMAKSGKAVLLDAALQSSPFTVVRKAAVGASKRQRRIGKVYKWRPRWGNKWSFRVWKTLPKRRARSAARVATRKTTASSLRSRVGTPTVLLKTKVATKSRMIVSRGAAKSSGRGAIALSKQATSQLARKRASRRLLTRMALRRAGRALTLALPVVGGIFALLAFRADSIRATKDRQRLLLLPAVLFSLAACADYVDALCQFAIAQTLFLQHYHLQTTGNKVMIAAESLSMMCAIMSTVAAVVGEFASHTPEEEDEKEEQLE